MFHAHHPCYDRHNYSYDARSATTIPKSFMNVLNIKGPKMELRGVPLDSTRQLLLLPANFIRLRHRSKIVPHRRSKIVPHQLTAAALKLKVFK